MNSFEISNVGQQSPKSGSEPALSLVRRRYATGLREWGDREWTVALGTAPQRWFAPLGTTDEATALRTAAGHARDLSTNGWESAGSRLPREFTMAVFWLETPMAVTYVTLFTLPRPVGPPPPDRQAQRIRLAIVEPDPVFRAALVHWLGRIPGCTCIGWENEQTWISQTRRRAEVDILLVNRLCPAFAGGRFGRGRGDVDGTPVFGYGLYPTSDDIFASVSGVESGYYLRRRSLASLLEPLSAAFSGGELQTPQVARTLRRYFQNLFTQDLSGNPAEGGLTSRERQILACIQRGLRDKEIATSLGISPLTVHTHLKHIFHKLGAHTRTEAVVKFLEK